MPKSNVVFSSVREYIRYGREFGFVYTNPKGDPVQGTIRVYTATDCTAHRNGDVKCWCSGQDLGEQIDN